MSATSLCLHTGARTVSREQVDASLTPPRTPSWVPIPHGSLLAGIESNLVRAGLSIVEQSHALTHDGNRYFGLLKIGGSPVINFAGNAEPFTIDPDRDFALIVGVRNSHDKKFPAGLVVGASVFVCDNLSFSGEVRLARKHTARIEHDLPGLIGRAIGRLGDLRHTQDVRFSAYRQHELTDANAHDIIVRSLDAGVLPVTHIPSVIKEWREPRHPEFREGRTAWRLFNAFSESLKGNLDMLPRRTQALHGLLDADCGLMAAG